MEGILAILIAAVSLALFLRKKKPPPKQPKSLYGNWDIWAMENGCFFYPPKRNIPMTIVMNEASYSIYIYAQKCDNLIEGFHDETEVNIQLKCNIADGLYIQSWKGIPKNRKTKTAEPVLFNKPHLDNDLYIEASDTKTARWIVQRGPFVSVCEKFAKETATSRIEQRTLILRQPSHDIEKLPALIGRALEYCMYIDNETLSIWNALAQENRLTLRRDATTGYPSIEGYYQNFYVKVRTAKEKYLQTEIVIEFEEYFSKDLIVLGPELRPEEHNEYSKRSFSPLSSTGCLYSFKKKHPLNAFISEPNILAPLMQIFQLFPESYIKNREIRVVIPNRANEEVAVYLSKVLALGEKFYDFCPKPTEEELQEMRARKERGASNRTEDGARFSGSEAS